ncbi:MAG TPA: terminase [Candidatus Faecivicinus avistercoris]|nr:terminase [Candidatus Faecivicinus avistercoris]
MRDDIQSDMLLALDPVAFSRYIGIDPDPWQAEVLRSEGKRLILNCCRQSGKSTTTATKALHTAIYRPRSLILLVSPSLRQSQELFRKVKDAYFAMKDRPALLEDNKLSMTVANQSRIISLPGDQSTVRGFSGVTMILEDEAAQVSDEFHAAIMPMLIINDGQLISMSTPFGKRGFFHEAWENGGDEWKRIRVTAEECPRMTPEQLEQQRRALGDMFYRQEFLCEFVETDEQTFNYDLIHRAFDETVEPLF